jgi:hypothetical protein
VELLTGEAVGMIGVSVGKTIGFASLINAKGSEWVGVATPFKLNAGDEVAVHAAIPITTQIKTMINVG